MLYPVLSVFIGLLVVNVWLQIGSQLVLCSLAKGQSISPNSIQAFLLALVLLTFFNINQFSGANAVFVVFLLATPLLLVAGWFALPTQTKRSAFKEFSGLLLLELAAIVVVFLLYGFWKYWLLESPNHDSLFYFEGMTWALDRPLLVASEAVRAHWGLGICGESSMMIGYDCSLYRGGSYTLAAWVQFFSPIKIPNSLYLLLSYVAVLAWVTVGMTTAVFEENRSRPHLIYWFGSGLLLTFSTAVQGALINSNLGTMLGASCVAMVIATLSARQILLWQRAVLVGLWAAVGTHIYAESIFYAGLIFSIALAVEFFQERHQLTFRQTVIVFGVFILTMVLAANFTLASALNSLLTFNKMAEGGNWPAWYIDAAPWTWLGSFVSGVLLGTFEMASYRVAFVGAIATLLALVLVWRNSDFRPIVLALVITSVAAIYLIEARSYRYGEHKILQLLGTSWSFVLVLGLREAFLTRGSYKPTWRVVRVLAGVSILVAVCYLIVDYGIRGARIMKAIKSVHSIYPGLQQLVSYIHEGDSVLIDDSGWSGMQKFQKTHYVTFLIHDQKARVVMPNGGGGGYYKNIINNTLKDSGDIQWLVTGTQSGLIQPPADSQLVFQMPDYTLYRVRPKLTVLTVPGSGWYDCEAHFCWTTSSFEIETVNPGSSSNQTLEIETDYFFPPANGKVTVTVNGVHLPDAPATAGILSVPIPPGKSRLRFSSSWMPESPAQRGLANDNRKLFSLIKSLRVTTSEPPTSPVGK